MTSKFVVALLVCVALLGCADKFVLSGSPEVAGLLIVEPVVRTKSFLGREDFPAPVKVVIRKTVGELLIEGEELDGLFVFQGLKPGDYQLISVSTKPSKKEVEYLVPSEDEKKLAFTINSADPTYLAVKVTQDMRLKDIGLRFDLDYSIARERAAWSKLLDQSIRSLWRPVVQRKLAAL